MPVCPFPSEHPLPVSLSVPRCLRHSQHGKHQAPFRPISIVETGTLGRARRDQGEGCGFQVPPPWTKLPLSLRPPGDYRRQGIEAGRGRGDRVEIPHSETYIWCPFDSGFFYPHVKGECWEAFRARGRQRSAMTMRIQCNTPQLGVSLHTAGNGNLFRLDFYCW